MIAKAVADKITQLMANKDTGGKITFLTGAGISKASGMPTYRGEDGLWVKGSPNYRPPNSATFKRFMADPYRSWQYTLFRLNEMRQIMPNAGHLAITDMANGLGERFHLITQNVDRLHHKAGTPLEKTYEIHGNMGTVRCSLPCTDDVYPMPVITRPRQQEEPIPDNEYEQLLCPICGRITRPNVLWFDELYSEVHHKKDSALALADDTAIMFAIGTSLATNLPKKIIDNVLQNNALLIVINYDETAFTQKISKLDNGLAIFGKSEEVLPELANIISLA